MRHSYECPLRWADLDLLGHVNNVRHVDLLTEGRRSMLDGLPVASAVVRRHRVEFARPLPFRRRPVLVDTWVTDVGADTVTLESEVHDGAGEATYVRAETTLAHRAGEADLEVLGQLRGTGREWRPVPLGGSATRPAYRLTVRANDTGPTGHVTDARHFEFFQESRVRLLMDLHEPGEQWTRHVVARTDLTYRAPVALRAEPYDVRSWVAHLGNRSFTICGELRDGDAVLASAEVVMVSFDESTQRPADMSPVQRERLEAELSPRRGC